MLATTFSPLYSIYTHSPAMQQLQFYYKLIQSTQKQHVPWYKAKITIYLTSY